MRDDLVRPCPAKNGTAAPRNWRRIVLLGVAGTAILYLGGEWLYRTFIQSDEDKIRAVLAASAAAARNNNPSGVTAILDESFRMPPGLDKDMVHRIMVRLLMVEFREIAVEISPRPVPVQIDAKDHKRARATFRARVRGRRGADAPWEEINARAGGSAFAATFRKTDEGWKMVGLLIRRAATGPEAGK